MPAVRYLQVVREIDLGLHEVVHRGDRRERLKAVELAQQFRQAQQGGVVADRLVAQLVEEARLEAQHLLLGGENPRLELLELGRDVALRVGQRLLTRVGSGGFRALQLADLDVIAENRVVPGLQARDAGGLALALLELGQHLIRVGFEPAELVELLVEAGAEEAAVGQLDGRRLDERRDELRRERLERGGGRAQVGG
jgi:hypothetical protein